MNINRHVVGGSAMHRPKKPSCRQKTWAEKKRDAQIRAINFIGKARIEALTKNWNAMSSVQSHGVRGDGDVADGILICLQKIGLSDIEIRSFLPVGGSRLHRVRQFVTNARNEFKKTESRV